MLEIARSSMVISSLGSRGSAIVHSQSLLRPSVFGLTILYLWARRFLSNPLNAIGIDAYDVDRLAYLIRLGSNFHFN